MDAIFTLPGATLPGAAYMGATLLVLVALVFLARQPVLRSMGAAAKRLFDFLAATFGLVLLAPVFAYLAWRIRRDSPGPVFYRGPRLGRGGRVFQILKFRTMYERPQSYAGPRITTQDDPRITRLGKWLRDTKLNELPQLWNVLVGEMSLVGPRPEDPELGQAWPAEVRQEVLSVRPGITSPASVQFRHEEGLLAGGPLMSTYMESIVPSKLRLDQLYVRHRSFWLDLDTLFWTVMLLVPRLDSYAPPEDQLLLGPVSRLVRRYLSWFTIDALISFSAMSLAGLFWRSLTPLNVGMTTAVAITLGFAMLFSLSGALLGVNRIEWSYARPEDAFDLLPPSVLATVLALGFNHLWGQYRLGGPQPVLPAGMIVLASAVALFGFVGVRYRKHILRSFTRRWVSRINLSAAKERMLIVGGGESGQFAAWLLGQRSWLNSVSVAGYVDDDLFKQGVRLNGVGVLGKCADIPTLVQKHDIGVLIFAIHNITKSERQDILAICRTTPARLVLVPDIVSGFNAILEGASDNPEAENGLSGFPHNGHALDGKQMNDWLAHLAETVETGDLGQIRAEIERLQARLS